MIDEKLFEQLKLAAPQATFPAPFAQKFNLNIVEFREGHAGAEVMVDQTWTNPFGIAHGGFLFTLLDEILGTACCSVLMQPIYADTKSLSTTNHDIFFHSPAKPGDKLLIKGRISSARKNMIFVEGHIKQKDSGVLVAESKGIWFVKR
jgi:acyl-CoA thioesterase